MTMEKQLKMKANNDNVHPLNFVEKLIIVMVIIGASFYNKFLGITLILMLFILMQYKCNMEGFNSLPMVDHHKEKHASNMDILCKGNSANKVESSYLDLCEIERNVHVSKTSMQPMITPSVGEIKPFVDKKVRFNMI